MDINIVLWIGGMLFSLGIYSIKINRLVERQGFSVAVSIKKNSHSL